MANELDGLSRAIQRSAEMREQERIKANEERGEPHYFIPDSDTELQQKGFGVGYWVEKSQGTIVAYRKMANGFERYPTARYDVALLERLVKLYDQHK